jgi:hypothetical protein
VRATPDWGTSITVIPPAGLGVLADLSRIPPLREVRVPLHQVVDDRDVRDWCSREWGISTVVWNLCDVGSPLSSPRHPNSRFRLSLSAFSQGGLRACLHAAWDLDFIKGLLQGVGGSSQVCWRYMDRVSISLPFSCSAPQALSAAVDALLPVCVRSNYGVLQPVSKQGGKPLRSRSSVFFPGDDVALSTAMKQRGAGGMLRSGASAGSSSLGSATPSARSDPRDLGSSQCDGAHGSVGASSASSVPFVSEQQGRVADGTSSRKRARRASATIPPSPPAGGTAGAAPPVIGAHSLGSVSLPAPSGSPPGGPPPPPKRTRLGVGASDGAAGLVPSRGVVSGSSTADPIIYGDCLVSDRGLSAQRVASPHPLGLKHGNRPQSGRSPGGPNPRGSGARPQSMVEREEQLTLGASPRLRGLAQEEAKTLGAPSPGQTDPAQPVPLALGLEGAQAGGLGLDRSPHVAVGGFAARVLAQHTRVAIPPRGGGESGDSPRPPSPSAAPGPPRPDPSLEPCGIAMTLARLQAQAGSEATPLVSRAWHRVGATLCGP